MSRLRRARRVMRRREDEQLGRLHDDERVLPRARVGVLDYERRADGRVDGLDGRQVEGTGSCGAQSSLGEDCGAESAISKIGDGRTHRSTRPVPRSWRRRGVKDADDRLLDGRSGHERVVEAFGGDGRT